MPKPIGQKTHRMCVFDFPSPENHSRETGPLSCFTDIRKDSAEVFYPLWGAGPWDLRERSDQRARRNPTGQFTVTGNIFPFVALSIYCRNRISSSTRTAQKANS